MRSNRAQRTSLCELYTRLVQLCVCVFVIGKLVCFGNVTVWIEKETGRDGQSMVVYLDAVV